MALSAAVDITFPSPFLPRTLHQHIKKPCLHLTALAEVSGTISHV